MQSRVVRDRGYARARARTTFLPFAFYPLSLFLSFSYRRGEALTGATKRGKLLSSSSSACAQAHTHTFLLIISLSSSLVLPYFSLSLAPFFLLSRTGSLRLLAARCLVSAGVLSILCQLSWIWVNFRALFLNFRVRKRLILGGYKL